MVAGDIAIAVFVLARRALTPIGTSRACVLFVGAAGVTMTAQQDGHGLGILTGATLASLSLLRRHLHHPNRECPDPPPAG